MKQERGMLGESDFDPIQNRDDFQQFVRELEQAERKTGAAR
jgi:hypothetical protein